MSYLHARGMCVLGTRGAGTGGVVGGGGRASAATIAYISHIRTFFRCMCGVLSIYISVAYSPHSSADQL